MENGYSRRLKKSAWLILSDYSAGWHSSRGLLSINVSAGSLSICEFNQPRRMEMRNPACIALVLLRNGILEQALHDSRQPRVELQERHGLQDQTMRHLMEILLCEKRQGFQRGAFFLDGIAAALASHRSLLFRRCTSCSELRGRDGALCSPSVDRLDGGASGRRPSTG